MIGSKKRFEVLKRDGFRCKYCGRNGKDVTLEVDHIIPKSKGGKDLISNLITCCRECNMGKGSDVIDKPSKNLYKQKIQDLENRIKSDFYEERNRYDMGTIDEKTRTLLSFYIKHALSSKGSYYYATMLNYPPLYGDNSIYGPDNNIDYEKMSLLFQQGGDFCDDVLDCIYGEFYECYLIALPEKCLNDEDWLPKNNKRPERFSSRLNYKLTEYMGDDQSVSRYFLYNNSLYPNLIENE